MTTFANHRAAARKLPLTISGRMGAGMGLLAMYPDDLSAGLLQQFLLFLNGRRIYPVLGIHDFPLTVLLSIQHIGYTFHGMFQTLLFRESVTVESFCAVAKIAGKRLFYNHVFILL